MSQSFTSSVTQTATQTSSSSANLYTAGQCTYYVFDKSKQMETQLAQLGEMLTNGQQMQQQMVTQ